MNIINKITTNNDNSARKDLGFRFMVFRKAILKTTEELAQEIGVPEQAITGIESGANYPEITILHFIHKKYKLNLNWMLTAEGQMFDKLSLPDKDDPRYPKYAELLELLKVPAVEVSINAALKQILALLGLELEGEREE